jgi:TonB family protein
MIEYRELLVIALLLSSLTTNGGCSSSRVQSKTKPDYNPHILEIIESDVRIATELTVAEALDKGHLDREPKMIHFEKPNYPRLPLQVGIEGTAVVEVIVDINGKVTNADIVMSSVTPSMEKSVLEASRKFLYLPGIRNDKAVECKVMHYIIFVIK